MLHGVDPSRIPDLIALPMEGGERLYPAFQFDVDAGQDRRLDLGHSRLLLRVGRPRQPVEPCPCCRGIATVTSSAFRPGCPGVPFLQWDHQGVDINLRLDSSQPAALDALTRARGMSRNEAAARAIEEAWTGHQARVRGLGAAAVGRYRTLRARLAR